LDYVSKRQRDCRTPHALEGTEEFVEFVGGVEIAFQFAGIEAFAEIVEAAAKRSRAAERTSRLVRTMSRQVE